MQTRAYKQEERQGPQVSEQVAPQLLQGTTTYSPAHTVLFHQGAPLDALYTSADMPVLARLLVLEEVVFTRLLLEAAFARGATREYPLPSHFFPRYALDTCKVVHACKVRLCAS